VRQWKNGELPRTVEERKRIIEESANIGMAHHPVRLETYEIANALTENMRKANPEVEMRSKKPYLIN
jgi:hypothetical protein